MLKNLKIWLKHHQWAGTAEIVLPVMALTRKLLWK